MKNFRINTSKFSKLRIIGGKLRGRKILFNPVNLQLRPTLNRVRETLFNWIVNDIVSSNCLDLFAGSGIFSFEAYSRGAHYVLAIEKNYSTYKDILRNISILNLDDRNFNIINQNALLVLQQSTALPQLSSKISIDTDNNISNKKFNIVFLDPPYSKDNNLLLASLDLLSNSSLIVNNAKIYFECNDNAFIFKNKKFLNNIELIKSGTAGQVCFYLVKINKL